MDGWIDGMDGFIVQCTVYMYMYCIELYVLLYHNIHVQCTYTLYMYNQSAHTCHMDTVSCRTCTIISIHVQCHIYIEKVSLWYDIQPKQVFIHSCLL